MDGRPRGGFYRPSSGPVQPLPIMVPSPIRAPAVIGMHYLPHSSMLALELALGSGTRDQALAHGLIGRSDVAPTSKPGGSSGGAGKWSLAEARRGIFLLHRRRREPRSFWPSHAALPVAVQKPGCGPVLAAGHVGQAGEKMPRRSGWPDTGRKRHRTATGV